MDRRLLGIGHCMSGWHVHAARRDPESSQSMLSLQVLRNEATGFAADFWALGCLLYRMLLGSTPFAAGSEYLIFERITSHDLQVPSTIAPAAQDLLRQLLESDASRRIGAALNPAITVGKEGSDKLSFIELELTCALSLLAGARSRGISELKEHPFFAGRPCSGSFLQQPKNWIHRSACVVTDVFRPGTAWQTLRKEKAPAAVQDDEQKDENLDWEWSSLAAALPVYSSPDGALGGTNTAPQSSCPDERHHSPTSQHHLAEHLTGPAAAAEHTKSALNGLLGDSTPSQGPASTSEAKISWQGKPGEGASSESSRPPQHGLLGSTAMSAADTGLRGSPSLTESSNAAFVPASTQHRAQAVRVTPAHERTAVGSPVACSTEKASGMPTSPKHDGHKPPAGTGHAALHHKVGNPRMPMRAPSRKGDFLSQAPVQAAYAGSGGRDDRADQAAGIMMLNQLIAEAHTYGAS